MGDPEKKKQFRILDPGSKRHWIPDPKHWFGRALIITWYTGNAEQVGGAALIITWYTGNAEQVGGAALIITWYTGNAEQVGGADLKGVEHLCRIVRIYHCDLDNERIF